MPRMRPLWSEQLLCARAVALTGLLFVAGQIYGQNVGPAPAITSLPEWSSNIRLSDDLRGRYVFKDPKTLELVIAFPSEPGHDDPLTVYRHRPQNQVDAKVTASVSRAAGGIRYLYLVTNGSQARLPITNWMLVVPAGEADIEISRSEWAFARLRHSRTRQAAIESASPGDALFWASGGTSASPVMPVRSAATFEIVSTFLPGLTTSYFQGGQPFGTSGGDLPPAVSRQMEPFMTVDQGFQVRLSVGPQFSPDLSKASIAKAWLSQLIEIRARADSSEAAFYDLAASAARSCATAAGPGCLTPEIERRLREPRRGMARGIAESLLLLFK